MSKLKKLLDAAIEDLSGDGERKVVKTWPMTKAEKKLHDEMIVEAKELAKAQEKLKHKRNRFWADTQERLNEYGCSLHVNAKKGVIEKIEGSFDEMADESLCLTDEDDED